MTTSLISSNTSSTKNDTIHSLITSSLSSVGSLNKLGNLDKLDKLDKQGLLGFCSITGLSYHSTISLPKEAFAVIPSSVFALTERSCPLSFPDLATKTALELLNLRATRTREAYEKIQTIPTELLAALSLSLAYPYAIFSAKEQPAVLSLSLLSLLSKDLLLDFLTQAVHFSPSNTKELPSFSLLIETIKTASLVSFSASFASYLTVLQLEFSPRLYSTFTAAKKKELADSYPELAEKLERTQVFRYKTIKEAKKESVLAISALSAFLGSNKYALQEVLVDLGFEKVAFYLNKLKDKSILAMLPKEVLEKIILRLDEALLEASLMESSSTDLELLQEALDRFEALFKSLSSNDSLEELEETLSPSISSEAYNESVETKAKTSSIKEILAAKIAAKRAGKETK